MTQEEAIDVAAEHICMAASLQTDKEGIRILLKVDPYNAKQLVVNFLRAKTMGL